MSKHQTIKTIRAEIDRLNREIDLKIIKGLSYKQESRRHKFLMSQLANLSAEGSSWFGRSFSFISSFMF